MNQLNHDPTVFADFVAPPWYQELNLGLAIRSQFVLSGNIRDLYPARGRDRILFVPFETAVWRLLSARGCAALLVHDPVDGLRLHAGCDPICAEILTEYGFEFGRVAHTPLEIADLVRGVMAFAEMPTALLLDYATSAGRRRDHDTDRMFIAIDKEARARPPKRPDLGMDCPPRNPILWLVDRPGDLPDWFVTRNPAVRDISVGYPDLNDRLNFMREQAMRLPDQVHMPLERREKRIEDFAVRAEGMMLADMANVVELSRTEGLGLDGIRTALSSYHLGTTRNPWTSSVVRTRVRNAMPVLEQRVKGQPRALAKAHDILIRSIMGLSGAQTTNRGTRPRGVLFFVGPTGVGKTELAKSIAEVMFGDETTMHRFDMSEFMSEESVARLLGPPPGAPGHENGGDLVNAVRARPFSVFLFDEIEKAHPRVLDVFLQILDDGRVSDQRGETGYFSEALIIFTSNVGMAGGDKSNNGGQNVLQSDSPKALENKLIRAVGDHFRNQLNRPELMNRLGQNIVPFEFINPRSAVVIFDAVTKRVIEAVREEHGVSVSLSEEARDKLLSMCIFELNDGGRGIGNRMESSLINPLARLLFRRDDMTELVITDIEEHEGEVHLDVSTEVEMLAGTPEKMPNQIAQATEV